MRTRSLTKTNRSSGGLSASAGQLARASTPFASRPVINGQVFNRSLLSNLINGFGPDFTHIRATDQTVEDHEGIVRTCIPGEIGLVGGRRAYNLVIEAQRSNNLSGWTVVAGAATFSADGNSFTVDTAPLIIRADQLDISIGNDNLVSLTIQEIVGAGETVRADENITAKFITPSTTSQRMAFGFIPSVVNDWIDLQFDTAGNEYDITDILIEDVTGRIDQNTPSEYVSSGVATEDRNLNTNSNFAAWTADDPDGWTVVAESSPDRKSTRLNSSHQIISYAVFCLKKKTNKKKKKKTHTTILTRADNSKLNTYQ